MLLTKLGVAVAVTAGLVAGPVHWHPVSLIGTPDFTSAPAGPVTTVQIAPGGAGTAISYTFQTTGRLVSVFTVFTTSAAAGSRVPRLQILDLANQVAAWVPVVAGIAPSQSYRLEWGNGLPYALNNVDPALPVLMGPTPANIFVTVGWKLIINVTALDVADQFATVDVTLSST